MFKINKLEALEKEDKEIYSVIQSEMDRQNNKIELIASENFVSPAVLEAAGSIMTNKYAEGLPGKRYYGGCEYVDVVEELAKKRLSQIFKLEENNYGCNVQPHSGTQANISVLLAMLNPADKIMGMDLSSGGHLSHGLKANFSGKYFEVISYGLDEKGVIDYDSVEKIALEHKPRLIIAGASAYPRKIDFKKFSEIAKKSGSLLMADIAHIAGLIAAGLHPTPIGYADFVTTTTHKTLRGPRGGIIIFKKEFEKKINSAVFPGNQGGPLMHIIAAKAVAFKEALKPEFKDYQKRIVSNAKVMANEFTKNGVQLVTGGTDNHLMLLDLRNLGIKGNEAEKLLDEIGITTNKNGIPGDPEPPTITSGIRIGTPAVTTRGFSEEDCRETARIIVEALKKNADLDDLRNRVKNLCKKHTLYDFNF